MKDMQMVYHGGTPGRVDPMQVLYDGGTNHTLGAMGRFTNGQVT